MRCAASFTPLRGLNGTAHYPTRCMAATIPIALAESVRAERLERGDVLCLVAFGSGLTWGSALVRW